MGADDLLNSPGVPPAASPRRLSWIQGKCLERTQSSKESDHVKTLPRKKYLSKNVLKLPCKSPNFLLLGPLVVKKAF